MAVLKQEDGRKWLNTFLIIVSIILGYIFYSLINKASGFWDLEAKIPYINSLAQVLGVFCGLLSFVLTSRNKVIMTYLTEVYDELVRVVWPTRDETVKLTIGILIGIIILSILLGTVDFVVSKLMRLLY
jgi:preprotein translocase subunit SecE